MYYVQMGTQVMCKYTAINIKLEWFTCDCCIDKVSFVVGSRNLKLRSDPSTPLGASESVPRFVLRF